MTLLPENPSADEESGGERGFNGDKKGDNKKLLTRRVQTHSPKAQHKNTHEEETKGASTETGREITNEVAGKGIMQARKLIQARA